MALYQAGDFQGGKNTEVSHLAPMKFLPLS